MASSTGQDIREELLEWGILLLLGTTVGTSTTTRIRDTVRLGSVAIPSTAYEDCWVRITSGALAGEISKVDYLDGDNGDLYVDPAFSGIPASGVTYEISRPSIHPDDLDRARDEALTRYCSQWALQPLSEILNADYEDALGTTWTAPDGGTLAIQANLGFPVMGIGRNALRVTNAAVNQFAQSTSLFGRLSQSFYLYVPVSARSGTAEVRVRDITNGANISLSGTATSTGRGWTGIEVTGQIPTGGNEIAVRLLGQEATAVVDWGPVNFHWQEQRRIALPDRIDSRKHVGRVSRLYDFPVRGENDRWAEYDLEEIPNVRRYMVNDSVVLQFSQESPMWDWPYFYQERIFYDALSAAYMTVAQREVGDAATTLCPLDYAAAGTVRVLSEWYTVRQPNEEPFWAGVQQKAQKWLDIWERRHGPPPEPVATRDRTIAIPHVRV